MTRTYSPAIHDSILTGLHTDWKLTDLEIAERMDFPIDVIKSNRERLDLRRNPRSNGFLPPKPRPDALAFAEKYLPGFDREKMTLKGRTIKLDDAMRMTNEIRAKLGLHQIDYCDRWVVPT